MTTLRGTLFGSAHMRSAHQQRPIFPAAPAPAEVAERPALQGRPKQPREGPDLLADPEAQLLSTFARTLAVGDRVYLHRRDEPADIPRLLRAPDDVMWTAWYEPFGITRVRAMACRAPAIVSAVGRLFQQKKNYRPEG